MGFYEQYFGSALIACACSAKPIGKQRAKIVPRAFGEVLELGMGAGPNIAYYDREKVTCVHAVEPSEAMRKKALEAAKASDIPVEILDGVGEKLPFGDARFDCVVCTYTLCTVSDVAATLAEARRVLKPGGRFLFCEHGLAPDADVQKWQRRVEPFWKPIGSGCHLTRNATSAIKNAFSVDWQEQFYLPKTPKILGWTEWGEAHV